MKACILQPNYIPWIGYFELINFSDAFIFLDDVQYTKRDWRNRNYINFKDSKYLLSIPVITKGKFNQKINQVNFLDRKFKQKHLQLIKNAYYRSEYFEEIFNILEFAYNFNDNNLLSNFNINLIEIFSKYLKLKTKFFKSSDFGINLKSNKKLVEICKKINADIYISGKKALNYLDEDVFKKENIKLKIIDYKKQKNYIVSKSSFINKLSILDLLFNQGPNSYKYLQKLEVYSYQDFLKNNFKV